MKKLIVLVIAVLAIIAGYGTYAYAMPQSIVGTKVVYVKNTNGNSNINSDVNENLIDGLKELPLPSVYSQKSTKTQLQPLYPGVSQYLGKWVVKKQLGKNPFMVHGKSPIGQTITISQSSFIDNAQGNTVKIKDPYYTFMTIPYYLLTQDYDINLYSQSGLPKQNLSVLVINPSNEHTPIQDPAMNSDALFVDNGNLVVVNGSSFFLCTRA